MTLSIIDLIVRLSIMTLVKSITCHMLSVVMRNVIVLNVVAPRKAMLGVNGSLSSFIVTDAAAKSVFFIPVQSLRVKPWPSRVEHLFVLHSKGQLLDFLTKLRLKKIIINKRSSLFCCRESIFYV